MKVKVEERSPVGPFLAGVTVGLLSAGVVLATSLVGVRQRPLRVEVATSRIAEHVREEVRVAVRRELPGTIASLRREIPARAAAEAGRRLAQTRVELGGFQVPVPPAAIQVVQSKTEEALRAGFDMAVRKEDLDATADRLSEQAYLLVTQRLNQMLAGQTFVVRPWPWISLPVTVVPQ